MSRAITIAGAKGGVGKTTTAINLAAHLEALGHPAVVLDLDLLMANVIDFLDLALDEDTDPTAHEVLAGEATLDEATYDAPGGVAVVRSGPTLEGYAKTDLDALALTIERLKRQYEHVILDTGAGVSRQNVEPLGGADEVIVVSTPRIASIRDAEKTIQLVDRAGGTVRGLVLTKSGTGQSPGPERISEFLDVPLLAHVPEDDAIAHSQDRGVPVGVAAPDSQASTAYRDLARGLVSAHETARDPTDGVPDAAANLASLTDDATRTAVARSGTGVPTESDGGTMIAQHRDDNDDTDDRAGPSSPDQTAASEWQTLADASATVDTEPDAPADDRFTGNRAQEPDRTAGNGDPPDDSGDSRRENGSETPPDGADGPEAGDEDPDEEGSGDGATGTSLVGRMLSLVGRDN